MLQLLTKRKKQSTAGQQQFVINKISGDWPQSVFGITEAWIELHSNIHWEGTTYCNVVAVQYAFSEGMRSSHKIMSYIINVYKTYIFNGLVLPRSLIHSYNTRNTNSFYISPCRTNIRQFAICFQGPKVFNSLNSDIQNSTNISLFKSKLRLFLLN